MPDIRVLKIFLSSPGDVQQQRDDAQAAIEEITATGEFDNTFVLKLYRWDDPDVAIPIAVTETPQQSVDIYVTKPSECDLVVVLFWSRMGTPLVMDEREYLSGTHYEYHDAIQGYQQNGRPTVWLYRCLEEPHISVRDPEREEKTKQFDRVEQFFSQFRDAEGHLTGGINQYEGHDDFKPLFKKQLITYLRHLRDRGDKTVGDPPPGGSAEPPRREFKGVPYRGLDALDEEDAAVFFGRDAAVLEVMARINARRTVFVLGASGSGKSSLVAAGILPQLRDQGWKIIRCTPTNDPFLSLALAMVTQIDECGIRQDRQLVEAQRLKDELRAAPERLFEKLAELLPGQKVLLFIDQFEEVFTLAQRENASNAEREDIMTFMKAIKYEPKAEEPAQALQVDITTILTMRADFMGIALPHFTELENDAYGLPRPSMFALLDLITRPAELAGLDIEDGLARHIVEEVGDQSGALSLIAYMMQALYLRGKDRDKDHMTRADYDELGGVQGVINKLADEAYADLDFDEVVRQQVMQTVFRELILMTEENGEMIPTRRRADRSEFPDGSYEAQFIETFVQARLLVRSEDTVEVAHEAILQHWQKLNDWVNSVKGDLSIFRQFERDAQAWEASVQAAAQAAAAGEAPEQPRPQPVHEVLQLFYRALDSLGYEYEKLDEPLKSYTEPEQYRLLRTVEELDPDHPGSHEARRDIGDRLALIGDIRYGVGVDEHGIPEIDWLEVPDSYTPVEFREYRGDVYGRFTILPFFIARYLVTYAQYRAFVEANDGYNNAYNWGTMPIQRLDEQSTRIGNAPRDRLSWYQSVAFANWMNEKLRGIQLMHDTGMLEVGFNAQIRLPTEWEWQWVAQNGLEGRDYPWVGHWHDGFANTDKAGLGRTTAVGMYPHDQAECGALDLCGNLREWCLNDFHNPLVVDGFNNRQEKAVRGGSYQHDPALDAGNVRRYPRDPSFAGDRAFGMRLVLVRTR